MRFWASFMNAVGAGSQKLMLNWTLKTTWTGYDKIMNLRLERTFLGEHQTIGSLYCDGVFLCYTLEDAARKKKIQDETCIPSGTYCVAYTWSGRFDRPLPLICDVPFFFGVRMHKGNDEGDTDACILLGMEKEQTKDGWRIFNCQPALDLVCKKFEEHQSANHTIEIVGGYSVKEMTGA